LVIGVIGHWALVIGHWSLSHWSLSHWVIGHWVIGHWAIKSLMVVVVLAQKYKMGILLLA